jgi:hypothetical protein
MKITWRNMHRVMAVSVGGIFIVWIVSGVVMVLPQLSVPSLAPVRTIFQPEALRGVTLSPVDAIRAVDRVSRKPVDVTNVQLRSIAGTIVYEIASDNGESYLIDARTGETVTVTEQMAQAIVQAMMVGGVPIKSPTLVSAYGADYRFGPLPVYRFEMSDPHGSVVYVSAHDGASRYTNRWIKIRQALEGLHSFDPVEWVTGSSLLRKGLLLFGSLIGGMVALTGYALARRRA